MYFRVESEGPKSLAIAVSLLAPEVQVLDMPVDPNEPTYCLCHQVSHTQLYICSKLMKNNNSEEYLFFYACEDT